MTSLVRSKELRIKRTYKSRSSIISAAKAIKVVPYLNDEQFRIQRELDETQETIKALTTQLMFFVKKKTR
jgi:TnpA family transposase